MSEDFPKPKQKEPEIDPIFDRLVNGTRDERVFMVQQEIKLFASYYFLHWFTYPFAPFHDDFFNDAEGLLNGELTDAAWIAFMESAKTTLAKIVVVYAILFEKKHYINWDSYDKDKVEAALFDIIFELQTNPRIREDFGSYYNEKRGDEEVKMKRVKSFITANGIKVEAFSTQESGRGRVFGAHRPDFMILDDFETKKTASSVVVTQKICDHINEMRSGLAPDGCTLYLCNYISETGSVEYLRNILRRIPLTARERFIPVARGGKPTWPAKYVMTDKEANLPHNLTKKKISLESKERSLGKDVFEENLMNTPKGKGLPFFDRARVDQDIANSKDAPEEKAGFRIWRKYNPSQRYAGGADVSEGVGLDSNASVFINFSTIPAEQVGSYDSNEIPPDQFAYEFAREGDIFGTCMLAPECNNQCGGTCLNTLLSIPYKNVFRQRKEGVASRKLLDKYGWETHHGNKSEIAFSFKSAYESGNLKINDVKILKEMRSFTNADLTETSRGTSGQTRHFDLLKAAFIAYAMKDYAPPPKRPVAAGSGTGYQQKAFESSMPNEE